MVGGEFVLVAVITALSLLNCALSVYYSRRYHLAHKKLLKNLDVDLELATSEQLVSELRKRPIQAIIVRPQKTAPNKVNVIVDVCGMTPEDAGLIFQTLSHAPRGGGDFTCDV